MHLLIFYPQKTPAAPLFAGVFVWGKYKVKGKGKMEIKNVKITELRNYENNPRKNSGAVDAVAESIKQFGFKVPIVIDNTNTIICGHTRLLAAKKLKLTEVPCIIADDLNDEQIKAFRLADNKTAELAEWDFDALGIELKELNELDVDMSAFGFDLSFLDEQNEVVEDEVPLVDEEAEPITKLGNIWELGGHRLMCGDSTDIATVETLMGGGEGRPSCYRPSLQCCLYRENEGCTNN